MKTKRRSNVKSIEIYDKDTKKLIRIVVARSFKQAIELFILEDEQKNVYCKNFKPI